MITAEPEPRADMTTASEDRVFGLWATPFLHFDLDEHEIYCADLKSLAVRAQGSDILAQGGGAATWLRENIDASVNAFLERWAEAEVDGFTVTGCALVHGHGVYQPLRNHPDAYLSGLYYVTAPKDLRDDNHRYDADTNALSFYDPRFGMNMGAIAKDPNADMEKLVRPEPGVMTIWPSFVDYFMHPNLSTQDLVAYQFNVVVKPVS